MRILLVSTNTAESPYPVYPLGMAAIAAALQEDDHEVRCFDLLKEGGSLGRCLPEAIQAHAPSIVGISIRNIDNVNVLNESRYLDTVREAVALTHASCDAPVLLGGAGFSVMPDRILAWTGADYGICGEGEALVREFADTIARGELPRERILSSKPSLRGDAIPSPHYDPDILSFYLESGKIASVQTKRGCPFTCAYCSYPTIEGHAIRSREPRAVVDDVENLSRNHGAGCIFFTDSVFNDSRGRYLDIVEELERRKLTVPWTAFFRPDTNLTSEIVARMKSTGLRVAEVGADCASDITLERMGKGFTFTEIDAFNETFLDGGVSTSHYFMFGGPGETRETAMEGIANIKSLRKTATFVFLGIRILEGVPLERIAIEQKILDPHHDLIEPVYYFSPEIDRAWLEETLTKEFASSRHVVFPPDAADEIVRYLHKNGFSGPLSDLFVQPRRRRRPRKPRQAES